jgi:VIT1/CCC1 family predicted Fe2+/Mn2+ transporter
LRAAVLGSNDGLVSNMSLVMGVAGAAVLKYYFIELRTNGWSLSMALGEWLSVQKFKRIESTPN